MIDWLRKNREFISILAINNYLRDKYGMPNSTIQKAVDGSQDLPKKWIEPLNKFLNNLKNCKSEGKNNYGKFAQELN